MQRVMQRVMQPAAQIATQSFVQPIVQPVVQPFIANSPIIEAVKRTRQSLARASVREEGPDSIEQGDG